MSETKTTTERYVSKYRNLRLVNKASHNREIDGRVVTIAGMSIQFREGVYETSDPSEIEFLDNHPNLQNGVFMKVPKKVKDAYAHQQEMTKSLEQRKNELDQREAELAKREKKLAKEEGASGSEDEDEDEDTEDGLEDLTRADLFKIAEEEGVEGLKASAKHGELVEAIRAKRSAGDKPEF